MSSRVRAAWAVGLLSFTVVSGVPTAIAEPSGPNCDPLNPGLSADSCANQPPQAWPIAQGDYTSPGDPGWIFFTPMGFDGRGCGIGPNGTVGCDIVPARWPDGTPVQAGMPGPPGSYSCGDRRCPLPPPDANQTVAGPQAPAEYVTSDAFTFTRDVDMLNSGYRLVNGDAWCAVGYQGTVSCATGANGFILSGIYGVLEMPDSIALR